MLKHVMRQVRDSWYESKLDGVSNCSSPSLQWDPWVIGVTALSVLQASR